ncbi:hypothetical protein AB1N83_013800 [Pleurotus pulmonarius]|nr:hypothetical protein EYR36_008627 [Pleurotus pulmonarius]
MAKGERLKVCISTLEMDEAAWKYGHHAQIMLDGTFGVCSSRMLLFISLAVDEEGKGVPLAFFLFSAPTGNRATHAGYNTDILEELLRKWKARLDNQSSTHAIFTPFVSITDTDTKERAALLRIWPNMCLLLCKFHLRQCWTNKRKNVLGASAGGNEFWREHIVQRCRTLEIRLIESIDHQSALALIEIERQFANHLLPQAEAKKAAQGSLDFLNYLTTTWMPISLWQSWSQWGRLTAAAVMKIPVEGVIPTTNHLESFNCILKRRHIPEWLHSGHRLRFDTLIHLLVTQILPSIFSTRKANREYTKWLSLRFGNSITHTSGSINLERAQHLQSQSSKAQAWWASDSRRDSQAANILRSGNIINMSRDIDGNTICANCYSTSGVGSYIVKISRSGFGSCSCLDFQSRGGACKHMRALRLLIDDWVRTGQEPVFIFPTTLSEAQNLLSHATPNDSPWLANVIPPIAASIVSNLELLQSLANDHTIIGSIGEAESIGSDLPDAVSSSETDGGFTSSGTQLHAIEHQVHCKIEHSIHQLLPGLHGLSILAEEARIPDTEETHEFLAVLQDLCQHFGVISNPATDGNLPPQTNAGGYSHWQTNHAHSQATLLPPSPERKQKRKKSHGTM